MTLQSKLSNAARHLGQLGASKGGIARMEKHYPNSANRKKVAPKPNSTSTPTEYKLNPVFTTIIDGNHRLGIKH